MIDDLTNINNQTELLESVGWDDEEFDRLVGFLNDQLAKDSDPKDILESIEVNFGKSSKEVLMRIFEQTIFSNNLHLTSNEEN